MLPAVAAQSVQLLFLDSVLLQWINFRNYPTTAIRKYLDSFLLVCSSRWETGEMEFQCLWHDVIVWQRSNAECFKIKPVSLHITLRKCVNKTLSAPCLLTSCADFRLLWTVACPSNQQMSLFGTIGSAVRLLGGFFLKAGKRFWLQPRPKIWSWWSSDEQKRSFFLETEALKTFTLCSFDFRYRWGALNDKNG